MEGAKIHIPELKTVEQKKGFLIVCPFNNYIEQKEKFFSEHPDIQIHEELKNISYSQVEVPNTKDILSINKTVVQNVVMVVYGLVYSEKTSDTKLDFKGFSNEPNQDM